MECDVQIAGISIKLTVNWGRMSLKNKRWGSDSGLAVFIFESVVGGDDERIANLKFRIREVARLPD